MSAVKSLESSSSACAACRRRADVASISKQHRSFVVDELQDVNLPGAPTTCGWAGAMTSSATSHRPSTLHGRVPIIFGSVSGASTRMRIEFLTHTHVRPRRS